MKKFFLLTLVTIIPSLVSATEDNYSQGYIPLGLDEINNMSSISTENPEAFQDAIAESCQNSDSMSDCHVVKEEIYNATAQFYKEKQDGLNRMSSEYDYEEDNYFTYDNDELENSNINNY